MTKTILAIVGAALTIVSFSSCATFRGVGEDVQKLGQSVENTAVRASKR